jgi:hypothetical protein
MANKNSKRRKEAARDAFGRLKQQRRSLPADEAQAEHVGAKPRKVKYAKVGASGPAIAKKLGHHINPEHQAPR